MTENDIKPLGKLSDSDDEWNGNNVKEFTVAKIAKMNKVVAYVKTINYEDEKTHENVETKKDYIYVTINDVTRPTRLNPKTRRAIQAGFGIDDLKKLVGKEIVATIDEFNGHKFIIWKPQNAIE